MLIFSDDRSHNAALDLKQLMDLTPMAVVSVPDAQEGAWFINVGSYGRLSEESSAHYQPLARYMFSTHSDALNALELIHVP